MKMKKVMAGLLAGLMAFSMVACGNKSASAEKTDAKDTNNDGKLVVGFDQDFPPFGYVGDDGEYTGFDLELAAECAKRMGQEIVYQPIDWDAKDMELESGTIDCIWNGFTMDGREDKYTWTDPYMDNSQVVVVRKDSGISGLDDLAGKIVEVQKESSAQSALEENTDLSGSFAQLLTVGAIAMYIFVAKDQLADKGDELVILDEQISSEKYAVGFLKGNTELRDQVQKTLEEMVADGTFAEISKKWFDSDVCILK